MLSQLHDVEQFDFPGIDVVPQPVPGLHEAPWLHPLGVGQGNSRTH